MSSAKALSRIHLGVWAKIIQDALGCQLATCQIRRFSLLDNGISVPAPNKTIFFLKVIIYAPYEFEPPCFAYIH